jgi:hypothetical protein
MQDGARLHTANVLLDFLHDTFNSRAISNQLPDRFAHGQNWPQKSPDLNPCDCYLWRFLEENIFLKEPQTTLKLRALIIQACNEITEDMCHRVINNNTVCVEVAKHNGSHVERLIHRG